MARVKALTDRTIAERFGEIKTDEQLWGEISTETRQFAQRILGSALEDELQHRLQAGALQTHRSPPRLPQWRVLAHRGQSLGRAGHLPAPRPDSRSQRRQCWAASNGARRRSIALIRQAFLRGVSTRQVGAVLAPVLGWQPSAQTVSTIAKALDQEVQRYHWRRVGDDWVYLLLDGVTMKVKHPGRHAEEARPGGLWHPRGWDAPADRFQAGQVRESGRVGELPGRPASAGTGRDRSCG